MNSKIFERQPYPSLNISFPNGLPAIATPSDCRPETHSWPAGSRRCADSKLRHPIATCLMLFAQLVRLAAARTACTAGNSMPTRMPMIAMTTSNSTSVNPLFSFFIAQIPKNWFCCKPTYCYCSVFANASQSRDQILPDSLRVVFLVSLAKSAMFLKSPQKIPFLTFRHRLQN